MTKLGESLRGTLIGRDHPDYEDARKLYNGMIDKRPLMIARCADVADVITAVTSAATMSSSLPYAAAATMDLDWGVATTGWSSICR